MVWIHGGAFIIGAGSQPIYDGAHLAGRGDVVVVTINYRLGPLGFLDLTRVCPDLPGAAPNCGMLDQVAALRWVHENIAAFGGNPDDVTIFGESAGGMSVGTLLAMPSARGLFHRAIPQSGAGHNFHREDGAARVAETFLSHLGLTPAEATQSLRELPAEKLVAGQSQTMATLETQHGLLPFQPVVDGDVLPEAPVDCVRAGHASHVQLMTGHTRDEWKLFGFLDMKVYQLDHAGLVGKLSKLVPEVDTAELVETYRRARADRGQSVEPTELFFAIETDRIFRLPATRLVEAQSLHQPNTYLYRFDWESPALGGNLGACHAVELPFVFGTWAGPGGEMFSGHGPDADALGARTMDAWLSFARNGSPGHDALPAWPAYDTDDRPTLLLGKECRLAHDLDAPERLFWDGVL
jgi:para-nitrobenzyl esterase